MTHGTADWGVTAGAVTTYQLTDLGELAARLGSIVTHDRRGDVIWLESFEDGLGKWVTSKAEDGGSVGLSATYSRNGLFSAKLVGGLVSPGGAQITRQLVMPALSPLGFEFSFMLATKPRIVAIDVYVRDGTNETGYRIFWSGEENVLYYYDAGDDPQIIATGIDFSLEATLFHTWKLVIDLPNGKYERLLVDATEYPLAAAGVYAGENPELAHVAIDIYVLSNDYENDVMYVDDVIVTQNEPV